MYMMKKWQSGMQAAMCMPGKNQDLDDGPSEVIQVVYSSIILIRSAAAALNDHSSLIERVRHGSAKRVRRMRGRGGARRVDGNVVTHSDGGENEVGAADEQPRQC